MTDNDHRVHPDDLEFMGRFHGFHPASVACGFLLLFLPAWLVLRGMALHVTPKDVGALVSAQEVRCLLDVVSRNSDVPQTLVIGDSVLREGALRAHRDSAPAFHSLVTTLRRRATLGPRLWDLGFEGLLPMDALAVVQALNRRNPKNAVNILLELTPRYASPDYQVIGKLHSRPLFRALSPREGVSRLALSEHRLGLAALRLTLPRWLRHPRFPDRRSATAPLELLARVRPHFLRASRGGPQIRALETLAAQCRGRLTAFETPIQSLFLDAEKGPEIVEETFRVLRRAVRPAPVLRPDGGRFASSDFLDHCHLTPPGNVKLARRIVSDLGWAPPPPPRPLVAWRRSTRHAPRIGWRVDEDSGDIVHEDALGHLRRPAHLKGFAKGGDAPTLVRWSAEHVYCLRDDTLQVRSFTDAGWSRSLPLPPNQKLADLAFDGRGRAVLILEATGAVLRLEESALLRGDRSSVEVLTRPLPLADLAGSSRRNFGLGFPPLHGHPTPMPPVSRVFTADDGETLLVWTRHPLWRGTVFRFNPTPGVAYPLWPADGEGHRFGPNPLIESRPHLWLARSRTLLFDDGMELLEERLRRFSWTYGTPPDPAGNSVTANGYTLEPPRDRPPRLRVGVFGSSVAGATRPLGADALSPADDGRPRLFSTLSVAVALERSLNARASAPVAAMDLTVPGGTLLDQLAGLSFRPADDLDAAVFTLGAFAFRTQATSGPISFSQAWSRLERDADGDPVVNRRRGFLPFASIGSAKGDELGLEGAIEELASELGRRCRRRGIPAWIVDMGRLTPLRGADETARLLFRAAARRHGLNVVVLAPPPDRADLMRTIAQGDRHLAPPGLDWVGRIAAVHMASSLPLDANALLASRHMRPDVPSAMSSAAPPRIPVPNLSALPPLDRGLLTVSKDGTHWRVVVEKGGTLAEVEPRRVALLALGRGVGPLLHRGDAVEIQVVRFLKRDEYGLGRHDAVEHLATFRISPEDLQAAVMGVVQAWKEKDRPRWLHEVDAGR